MAFEDLISRRAAGFLDLLTHWQTAPKTYRLIASAFLLVLYLITVGVYRVWFHPLSAFPGPKRHAATRVFQLWKHNIQGLWFREIAELHREYGPIVRIGPNQLVLDGNIGWQEIFAHTPGKAEFRKVPNWNFEGDGYTIIGAPTAEIHRRQRGMLAHAFSNAALKEQEHVVSHYIDLLMTRLKRRATIGQPTEIVSWLNFTTFDIMGDLTFADSFHCLDNNNYHPYVSNIFRGINGEAARRFTDIYPLLKPLIYALVGTEDLTIRGAQKEIEQAKMQLRIGLGAEPKDGRRDFATYMLKESCDGKRGMDDVEVTANSCLLIASGGETTGTSLSGIIFHLGTYKTAYERLAAEVRDTFRSKNEINMSSTRHLEYLHGVIEENLRVYPPTAETTPRVSPGVILQDRWVPKGTLLSIYPSATYRNPDNFADPDMFVPERWLPSSHPLYDPKYANDAKAAFQPFGHGPRDCIGKNFAYAEMRLLIARLLYGFDFELAPGQEQWRDIQRNRSLWDKGPLYVILKPRLTA